MFAIFLIAKKQYYAKINDIIYAEKLDAKVNDEIVFDQVLTIDDKIGCPYIKGAKVVCKVEKHGKKEKITVIKHLPQKHHNRKHGHRQQYTKLIVKNILCDNGI